MKPILFSTAMVQAILEGYKTQTRRVINPQPMAGLRESVFVRSGIEDGHGREVKPKYLPGDVLYVRETWNEVFGFDGITHVRYIYKQQCPSHIHWRPSIFMPRKAARIFLRTTDVRAEKVQEITEEDAYAEGVITNAAVKVSSYVFWFESLWNRFNYKRGYGWDANPWVWVYTFELITREEALKGESL